MNTLCAQLLDKSYFNCLFAKHKIETFEKKAKKNN